MLIFIVGNILRKLNNRKRLFRRDSLFILVESLIFYK